MNHADDLVRLLATSSNAVLATLKDAPSVERLDELALSHPELSSRLIFRQVAKACHDYAASSHLAAGIALGFLTSQSAPKATLVTSSPSSNEHRQTAGVLASLFGDAVRSVSFCTYVIAHIEELLPTMSSASSRGVEIKGIVDDACTKTPSGRSALDAVRRCVPGAQVRVWRDRDCSLHAKFLVVDSTRVWISSANLTGRALTNNVELGVILSDHHAALSAENLFESLYSCAECPTDLDWSGR